MPDELTERERRISERLDALSQELGDLFRAAVRESRERADSSWIRLATHACREIVNRLPDYLDIPVAGRRLDYTLRFRAIAAQWPEDISEPPSEAAIQAVVELVLDDRATTASIKGRAAKLFENLETGDPVYSGDMAARAELWVELQRYFVSVAHLAAPGASAPDTAMEYISLAFSSCWRRSFGPRATTTRRQTWRNCSPKASPPRRTLNPWSHFFEGSSTGHSLNVRPRRRGSSY